MASDERGQRPVVGAEFVSRWAPVLALMASAFWWGATIRARQDVMLDRLDRLERALVERTADPYTGTDAAKDGARVNARLELLEQRMRRVEMRMEDSRGGD